MNGRTRGFSPCTEPYWLSTGLGRYTSPTGCVACRTRTSVTPMEKYDAENANAAVVDVLLLMRMLLADVWDPSTAGEMLVY